MEVIFYYAATAGLHLIRIHLAGCESINLFIHLLLRIMNNSAILPQAQLTTIIVRTHFVLRLAIIVE